MWRALICGMILSLGSVAWAEIYTCPDGHGGIFIQSAPCPGEATSLPAPKGDTLKGGFTVCATLRAFEELLTAHGAKDEHGVAYLERTRQCMVPTLANVPVSILRRHPTLGLVRVRVYVDEEAMIFWTYSDNIAYAK